jgi:hypothetical protein
LRRTKSSPGTYRRARSARRTQGWASPGARRPRTTERSTRSGAPGSTAGPGLGTSQSAWRARAASFNSPGTTSKAGAQHSTRRGWSTRRRARRAPDGSERRGTRCSGRRGAGGKGLATAKARFEFLASVPVDVVYAAVPQALNKAVKAALCGALGSYSVSRRSAIKKASSPTSGFRRSAKYSRY